MNGKYLLRSSFLTAMILTSVTAESTEWANNASATSVPLGGSFHLTCQLSSPGTVIWSVNSTPLGFGNMLFTSRKNGRFTLAEIDNGSELMVVSAQREDTGLYKCQATDMPDLEHVISVLSAPTLSVNCSVDTGMLVWEIDEEVIGKQQQPSSKSIRIERKRKDEQNWTLLREVEEHEDQAEVKLMVADQVFRIVWTDSLGIEWVSNVAPESKCTAPEDVPLANPTDLQASILEEAGNLNLLVYWTPIPQDYGMGSGFYYLLMYKEKDQEKWKEIKIYNREQYKYTKTLPNEENTTYSVKIYSANDLGVCKVDPEVLTVGISRATGDEGSNSDSSDFVSIPRSVLPVYVNGRINMPCEHDDQDIYPMVWYNGSEVIALMGYKLVSDSRINVNKDSLTIQQVNLQDAGEYTCKIQSNHPSNITYLVVVGGTVEVYGFSASCGAEITNLYWSPCFNYREYGYSSRRSRCIQDYYRGSNEENKRHLYPSHYTVSAISYPAPTIEETVNETRAQIRLRPNRRYTFHITSTNIIGQRTTSFGNYYKSYEACETGPGKPWRHPGDVAISRTLTEIMVFWQPLLHYEHHAPGFTYKIQYSSGSKMIERKVNASSYEIYNIDHTATYTISIISTNDEGDCEEPATNYTSYPLEEQEIMDECLPSLILSEEDTIVKASEGDSITLTCQNPENNTFLWRRLPMDKLISMDDSILLDDSRLSIMDSDLSIDNVHSGDFGYYQCTIYAKNETKANLWKLTKRD